MLRLCSVADKYLRGLASDRQKWKKSLPKEYGLKAFNRVRYQPGLIRIAVGIHGIAGMKQVAAHGDTRTL